MLSFAGYETRVGERGLRLSGGEKVCSEARASSKIIVLRNTSHYTATRSNCPDNSQGSSDYSLGRGHKCTRHVRNAAA